MTTRDKLDKLVKTHWGIPEKLLDVVANNPDFSVADVKRRARVGVGNFWSSAKKRKANAADCYRWVLETRAGGKWITSYVLSQQKIAPAAVRVILRNHMMADLVEETILNEGRN